MKKVAISFIILGSSFILGTNLASANTEEVIYDLDNHNSIYVNSIKIYVDYIYI